LENALQKKKILTIDIPDDEDEFEDLDKVEAKPKYGIQNEDDEPSYSKKKGKKQAAVPIFE
jgi:hypothetical protein